MTLFGAVHVPDSPAHVHVQEVCEVIIEQLQALSELLAGCAVCNGPHKQVHEPAQAVLVHGVNGSHVSHTEVQQ